MLARAVARYNPGPPSPETMDNPPVDQMLRVVSGVGLLLMVGVAWVLSENRRRIQPRILFWGLGLQFAIGLLLLKTPLRNTVFRGMARAVQVLVDSTLAGARFVFGTLPEDPAIGAVVAFQVLPIIIFVTALASVFYHLGAIQAVVNALAWAMRRTLKTSGAETLGVGLLIFFGIESVAAVRAYLAGMTRSELLTLMTTFMATIAGSVMVTYATFGAEPGHLLTASLMSAPAAILMAKVMVPETGEPATSGSARVRITVESHNVFDAVTRGTHQGLQMALAVGAMLLVFVSLIALLDFFVTRLTGLTFVDLLAYGFRPVAYVLGAPPDDTAALARLLSTKTVFNEFLAYLDFRTLVEQGALTPRGAMIATYALCGFANPGSIGILIAGLDALVPERRAEITALSVKAFIGGTLACFSTACIAGIIA
jgi:CNT family concentrative nucleoside transporter